MLEHRITALDRPMIFAIAVRWFATGDQMLCETMAKLIGGVQDQLPFDASLAGFGLTGNQMIALCHKAVGYMPLAPIVAASFVIAALRADDKGAEPELVQLLLQRASHQLSRNRGELPQENRQSRRRVSIGARGAQDVPTLRKRMRTSKLPSRSYSLRPTSERWYGKTTTSPTERYDKQAERQSIFFGLVHQIHPPLRPQGDHLRARRR